ncbi:hypothetical protein KEM56_001167 [Ascosphaera pollenicola]|nr:hypothetical protein KEM56_001167 [Ascosphaera pollenicola]
MPEKANAKAKGDLPDFVTVRIRTNSAIEDKKIRLDDNWRKEIVRETWKGDLTVPRTITRPQRKVVNEIVEAYALLAHASAAPVGLACTKCLEDNILDSCRVNAVWPASASCTTCGYKQTPNACSLRGALNDRACFMESEDERKCTIQAPRPPRVPGLTWEQWLEDGLSLLKDRENAAQFHDKLKASETMVSKLLEMERCAAAENEKEK